MIKLLFTLFVAFLVSNSYGQNTATLVKGKIKYQNKSFAVGDTINLGSGSTTSNNFAFVHYNSSYPLMLCNNFKVIIKSIGHVSDSIFIKGKLINPRGGTLAGKLDIELQNAIHHRELKL